MDIAKHPTIKDTVTSFGNDTTIHGLQYVVNGSHFLYRLCWLAICIFFFVIFMIQGLSIMTDFRNFPYSTKIDIVSQPSLGFPAVTLCNANRMRRSQLLETRFEELISIDGGVSGGDYDYSWWFSSNFINGYGSASSSSSSSVGSRKRRSPRDIPDGKRIADLAHEVVGDQVKQGEISRPKAHSRPERSVASSSTSSSTSVPLDTFSWYNADSNPDFEFYDDGWDAVQSVDDWHGFYANSKADDYSDFISVVRPTKEELETYGHRLEDFILQCTFDRQPCNITQDFMIWQNQHFGNCFTFNSKSLNTSDATRITGKTGALNGLHLTLFIEQPEYIGILSPHTGAKLSVHDPNVRPYPEDDAIDLATGMSTSVGVRQESIQRLGGSYGNCTKDGQNTNFTSDFFSYTAAGCRKTCYQLYLDQFCNCVDDVLFEEYNVKCSVLNRTQQWCLQYIEERYLADMLQCSCPSPCDETKYVKTISSMIWPSERYEEHLQNKLAGLSPQLDRIVNSNELSRKNLLRIKIYYEELNFENVQQVPVYTVAGLLGSVGGLMGLYIGMSFISLFEVTFLVLEIGKIAIEKLCCRNRVNPTKTVL